MFETEEEKQAFESLIQERVASAIASRMAELQFGSMGPMKRSMGAVGGRVDAMANQARQMDKQLAATMTEIDRMVQRWKQTAKNAMFEKGKRPVDAPDITKELRRAKGSLDKASDGLGQIVEDLFDAARILG